MDYTNFIKTYYQKAIRKLQNFSLYKGATVYLNHGLAFDGENYHIAKHTANTFLPSYELNINAPVEKYIEYLNFYCELNPSLAAVYRGEEGINQLYTFAQDKGILSDDEKSAELIDLSIDISIEVLKQAGVLK